MASETFCWLMGVEKLCSSANAMPCQEGTDVRASSGHLSQRRMQEGVAIGHRPADAALGERELEPDHVQPLLPLHAPAVGQLVDEEKPPAARVVGAAEGSALRESGAGVAHLDAQPVALAQHLERDLVRLVNAGVANAVGHELGHEQ